jgi:hypothetical protein
MSTETLPISAPRRPGAPLRIAALAAALLVAPLATLAVPRSGTVAVVGAPGANAGGMAALVARAGGSIVRPGGLANVIVAVSAEPGFAGRLYGAGAWLVLDPVVLGGCLTSSS